MFPRNSWYVAAWDHEVKRLFPMRRILLGAPVVLYRASDGAPVALEDRCCHRHAQLSRGRVRGDTIECAYHGLRFAPRRRLRPYPEPDPDPGGGAGAQLSGGREIPLIWFWPGDPALADESRIPDFGVMDHPGWNWRGETLAVAGNAMLAIENLMDLSHLPALHRTTLADTAIPENDIPVEYRIDGDTIRVDRWVLDTPVPPYFRLLADFAPDARGRPLDEHGLHAAGLRAHRYRRRRGRLRRARGRPQQGGDDLEPERHHA